MNEFNKELPNETEMNETTDGAMEGALETADVKPTTAPKPPRTKKAPKETDAGETQVVLANLTVTKNSNTKEPETIDLGNGIIAINR